MEERPMLSRVAESLYWMSRYLERAEHTARLLEVNLFGRLDQQQGGHDPRWARVLRGLSVPVPATGELDVSEVVQRLTFDAKDPYSIVSCIASARRNAREIREQISSEMWEQMNKLYLYAERTRPTPGSDSRTYDFLQAIRQGSHLFQGCANTTMSRGQGWYFMQLGRFTERAVGTVNLLDAHMTDYANEERDGRRPDEYLEWANLLKSCNALEAYCRVHTANILPERGAAFLLLDPHYPHSIRFSVEAVHTSLDSLAASAPLLRRSDVHRRLGKLLSSLSFDLIEEIVAGDVHQFLGEIRGRCAEIHEAVYSACINYPLDQALTE
jgi:uncharacterized alpha-E superfamily protein